MIFCPGRYHFTWQIQEYRLQTELEFGIRAITSSIIIAKHIQTGNPLETGLQWASLLHLQNEDYNPRLLRRKFSVFLDTHAPSMINIIPRNRRLQLNLSSVNNCRNKQ